MSKHFLPYSPDQPYLLPASPQDWLPEGHLAYLVQDLVDELDLTSIHVRYQLCRGAPALDPKMMVAILVYAWASAVYSSRKIAALCTADLGGRYLAAGYHPDFRTVNTFRLQHAEALAGLFEQSVRLCRRAGMVGLGHVAVDASKLRANAGKHKAMSYARMGLAEERLRKEIADYQRLAAEADKEEDRLFGKDQADVAIPAELKHRNTRLARIREAREALEAEAKAAAQERRRARQEKGSEGERGSGSGTSSQDEQVAPPPNAQRNFTDPESRIMKNGQGDWIQGYNGQAAVDSDHQVIVACELTNKSNDAPHLPGLLRQVERNTGGKPAQVSADAGYFNADNVLSETSEETQVFIPPDRLKHNRSHSLLDRVADSSPESVRDWMRVILSTTEGAAAYAKRKQSVEPVFGQIKGCPGSPGFRAVLRRGLVKANQEWHWVCAVHNFKKLLRYRAVMPISA